MQSMLRNQGKIMNHKNILHILQSYVHEAIWDVMQYTRKTIIPTEGLIVARY